MFLTKGLGCDTHTTARYHGSIPETYCESYREDEGFTHGAPLTARPVVQYHSPVGLYGVQVMKSVLIQRALACVLVFCILAIGGLASAQSITHESHHAHHQKATHGTALCSWMCAAGQAGEATVQFVPVALIPHDFVELTSTDHVQTIFSGILATRAPPIR